MFVSCSTARCHHSGWHFDLTWNGANFEHAISVKQGLAGLAELAGRPHFKALPIHLAKGDQLAPLLSTLYLSHHSQPWQEKGAKHAAVIQMTRNRAQDHIWPSSRWTMAHWFAPVALFVCGRKKTRQSADQATPPSLAMQSKGPALPQPASLPHFNLAKLTFFSTRIATEMVIRVMQSCYLFLSPPIWSECCGV